MINFLNKKNNYDFIHQFQWINKKPKLNNIYIDNINNNIIHKNNLIYPTYYSLLLLFNQKPAIKTTKKSIAGFWIRPNMNLGGFITLNSKSFFMNKLFYFVIPNLKSYNNKNKTINYSSINNQYNIHCNYGVEDFISKISSPQENNLKNYTDIGGVNIIFHLTSPTKHMPFYYLP